MDFQIYSLAGWTTFKRGRSSIYHFWLFPYSPESWRAHTNAMAVHRSSHWSTDIQAPSIIRPTGLNPSKSSMNYGPLAVHPIIHVWWTHWRVQAASANHTTQNQINFRQIFFVDFENFFLVTISSIIYNFKPICLDETDLQNANKTKSSQRFERH